VADPDFVWRERSPSGEEFEVVVAPPGSFLDVGGAEWQPPRIAGSAAGFVARLAWPVTVAAMVAMALRRGAITVKAMVRNEWRVAVTPLSPAVSLRPPAVVREAFSNEADARERAAEVRCLVQDGKWAPTRS
jgi:hypothetical protein